MRILLLLLFAPFLGLSQSLDIKEVRIDGDFILPNTVPPLDYDSYFKFKTRSSEYIPVKDQSFIEHECTSISDSEQNAVIAWFDDKKEALSGSTYNKKLDSPITGIASTGSDTWIGTAKGLYLASSKGKPQRHDHYGINGPLSSKITALATDSRGNLWVGTPIGLSVLEVDGTWRSIRGTEGLPVEDITALAVSTDDELWIGTSSGAILYKPQAEGRQWFYRASKRYLIDDMVQDVFVPGQDSAVYFLTAKGVSKISIKSRTLAEKAQIMEDMVNKWHRRLGLVAACELDDRENPTSATIPDSPNDGLWTSYHVVAMSLAYGTTGDEKYLVSAKKGMYAMIMLQNVSGIPGVIARSVLPADHPKNGTKGWVLAPDKKMIWRDDTSSDEIDGHFFAFYAYWEHIARHNPEEADVIKKQVSQMMNTIVDNNYQLLDWNGERTKWGFWNPEALNHDPNSYLESGLNAAQILSFLKVSYYITGDPKFKQHYDKLIVDHGYLGNVLLEKKVFPDMNNHSDNQLGYCALYPLLQLEHDPKARVALQKAVRRHHRTLRRDGSSFFYFAAATIDLEYVEISDAVEFLRQMPTDRRQWKMKNSHRADITWHPYQDRFEKDQLLYALPVDERNFDRWNKNPYYADSGRGGEYVDGEGSWLLAYWMGRYHGFIGEEE
ncbi:MAG: two-component regulator propeller domain-containing protein [Cyclobacteriaceae bacterium]